MPFEAGSSFPSSTFIKGSSDSGKDNQRGRTQIPQFPESSIYHKGEVLDGCSGGQALCDGEGLHYSGRRLFELLTLHQYGWRHSVATLGTALTPQHIRTLKRYTKNLITLFDADEGRGRGNPSLLRFS